MARIVPTLVVTAIEQTFPWAKLLADGTSATSHPLGVEHAVTVGMVAGLLDAIPSELLPTDASDYFRLAGAIAAMKAAVASWGGGGHPNLAPKLDAIPGLGRLHPLAVCIQVLRACPDEAPAENTAGLAFLPSEEVRRSIRADLANAYRALGNGEYKSATVLAGSLLEALLLWRLKGCEDAVVQEARRAVNESRRTAARPLVRSGALEDLVLADYADLAHHLQLIDSDGHVSILLSNNFRNLIHPGRVLRKGEEASQATALMAVGALTRLIDLLERQAA